MQFNYEYREFQKAAKLVAQQAHAFRAEAQVKQLQFQHCPEKDYERLLVAWKIAPVADQDMDDLASMMIG